MPEKRPRTTGAKTGQPVEEYQDLSKAAPEPEILPDTATVTEEPAGEPEQVFQPKRPYSMIWHNGLKHYHQDGIIFDRGSKKRIG